MSARLARTRRRLAHRWTRGLFALSAVAITGAFSPAAGQFDNGYSYKRVVNLADDQVKGGPHANFAVLLSLTLDDLRTAANGGKVESPAAHDIIFTSDEDGTNPLAHQIENYDPVTGEILLWVRVESLEAATLFHMFYGNSSITSFQGDIASNGATGVWDDDFRAVWHLNETTGSTHSDATNNGNDGTPEGPPEAVKGKIGGALDFDVAGDGTRIDIPSNGSLNVPHFDNFTLSAWVQPKSYSGVKWPTAYAYHNHATLGLAVEKGPNGRIEHWRNDQSYLHSDSRATLGEWNHIAVVRDPSTTRFYLNGIEDGFDSSVNISQPGRPSSIGSTPTYPGEDDFLGLIDEVRVSSASRSSEWIQTEFNNQFAPSAFYSIGPEETQELVDLEIIMAVDDPTPYVGDAIKYTVTVTNHGPSDATGVSILDQLPEGVTYVSDSASQGSYDSETGIWNVGTILSSGTGTLTIETTVDDPGNGSR